MGPSLEPNLRARIAITTYNDSIVADLDSTPNEPVVMENDKRLIDCLNAFDPCGCKNHLRPNNTRSSQYLDFLLWISGMPGAGSSSLNQCRRNKHASVLLPSGLHVLDRVDPPEGTHTTEPTCGLGGICRSLRQSEGIDHCPPTLAGALAVQSANNKPPSYGLYLAKDAGRDEFLPLSRLERSSAVAGLTIRGEHNNLEEHAERTMTQLLPRVETESGCSPREGGESRSIISRKALERKELPVQLKDVHQHDTSTSQPALGQPGKNESSSSNGSHSSCSDFWGNGSAPASHTMPMSVTSHGTTPHHGTQEPPAGAACYYIPGKDNIWSDLIGETSKSTLVCGGSAVGEDVPNKLDYANEDVYPELPFPDDYWTYDPEFDNYYHIDREEDGHETKVWYPEEFLLSHDDG